MAPKIASQLSHLKLQQRSDCDDSESSSFGVREHPELSDSDGCNSPIRREPRHVTFLVNNDQENAGPVSAILETDSISEEEERAYYMQPDDFKRCDEEIKRTVRKWLKRANENEPFDHEYCTTRGTEQLIDHMQRKRGLLKDSRSFAEIKSQHMEDVLKEVKRQQSSKTYPLNEDRIRQVSLRSAGESVYRSLEFAEQDEEELRKIHPRWSVTHPRGPKRSLVQIQAAVQDDITEASIKGMRKPPKSLKPIDIVRRRGSMLGSFLRRKK
jgi:hypothetical protein